MKACLILPTYNEAENIERVIRKIKRYKIDILVVDDDSPDGTARIAEELGVKVLKRKRKEGLGKAYIAGFEKAMNDYDVLFEMDADMSHNPRDIPKLLKEIINYDFVIGSRYVEGGKISGWNLRRKIISYWGNVFGKHLVNLKINDCTSGYRAIQTSLLKKIDLKGLGVGGYAFQVSLLRKAQEQGARIREIPITFVDRKRGKSKLGIKDIIEFMFVCLRYGVE